MGNTVYGNGSHGIEMQNYAGDGTPIANLHLWNNTCVDNGGYGFYWGTASPTVDLLMDYNHTHNNTSGVTDRTGGLPGDNNVTGDPLFTSTTDGSEDFTPLTGSPLIGAGVRGAMIGAVAHADGGGNDSVFGR